MKVSIVKSKVMAFPSKEPISTKVIINYQIMEQVSHLNYLGNYITCDKNYDTDSKLGKFQIINCSFRDKVR